MAERAPTLSSRGWLQLGSLQIDLGTRTQGRSSVPLPRFLGSLATLAVILVGLSGIAPRRPASVPFPPLPVPFASSDEARPSLGPPIVAPPSAPVVPIELVEADAGDQFVLEMATLPEVTSSLISLPPVSLDRSVSDTFTLRDVAKVYEVDATVLATFNGLAPDAADDTLSKQDLSVPLGLVEVSSLKLRADPPPPATVSYVISAGDTLSEIALRFGVDPDTLAAANGLANPDFIHPGDQLSVSLWNQPALFPVAPTPLLGPASPSLVPTLPSSFSPPPPIDSALIALPEIETVIEPAITVDALLTPARPATPVTYEVEEGDTVSVIAERFGVDTETIVASNGLASPDRIRIGDELTILPVSGVLHTVREGQTLSEIAELYRVDLGPIIDFNYLDDADLITVGKELLIPGGRPLPPPTPRVQTVYQVSPGDTLSSIAVRFGVTSGVIASANAILNPDRLAIGARLSIPGVSGLTQPGQQVVTRNLPVFTPAPTANLPISTGGGGDGLASYALRFLGSRYAYGGTTPAGFDCSGFVYYIQANAGAPVGRGMWGQYSAGAHPARSQLQPGDLVFFQNTYMAGLSHNGIYIGNGNFIHASDERSGVKISNINEGYWSARWFGATRAW